jgi:hypothetical protein
MSAYFNAFVNGDLEPTSTHFWLLAGAIFGSLVVAAGIALEANWPLSRMKPRELAGITFVFFGVGIEALFTLALFMFDEGLSSSQQKAISAQQSRIAELDAKTSAAESEAARAVERAAILGKEEEELKAKNLALEAEIEPRKLSDDDIKRLIDTLKPFVANAISVKSYLGDSDGHRLLMILSTILARAGLKVSPGYWYFDTSAKMVLLMGTELDAPPEQKNFADAFQKAFSETRISIRPQWYPAVKA